MKCNNLKTKSSEIFSNYFFDSILKSFRFNQSHLTKCKKIHCDEWSFFSLYFVHVSNHNSPFLCVYLVYLLFSWLACCVWLFFCIRFRGWWCQLRWRVHLIFLLVFSLFLFLLLVVILFYCLVHAANLIWYAPHGWYVWTMLLKHSFLLISLSLVSVCVRSFFLFHSLPLSWCRTDHIYNLVYVHVIHKPMEFRKKAGEIHIQRIKKRWVAREKKKKPST